MNSKVNIDGMDEVLKNLQKYGQEVKKANKQAVEHGAKMIVEAAKDNIGKGGPFPEWITGELENLIKYKVDGVGNTYAVAHIGTIGASKEQAIKANAVEYGHAKRGQGRGVIGKKAWKVINTAGKVKEKPYLRPALKSSKKIVSSIYEEEVRKVIKDGN
ncbi:MAG TPA: HK97-gp10 family putative phage morphogenesis protein [Bacillota bacterium]|nr:HK97-gp10 family putative phage morphogenesis protein [Bacillota bacterium]